MTAFELCGDYNDESFRLKGGSVIWDCIYYKDSCDKCYITRVVESGGKDFLMGLGYQHRYISPDTIVEIITNKGEA